MSTVGGYRLNEAAAETEDEDKREQETPTVRPFIYLFNTKHNNNIQI